MCGFSLLYSVELLLLLLLLLLLFIFLLSAPGVTDRHLVFGRFHLSELASQTDQFINGKHS